ncbi:MAG: NAD-dependent deacylase [Anaerolineales bacterium]|nr:NAD-dependent deacylase [Anaerolineales bacterium]
MEIITAVHQAARLLKQYPNTVVLTGAGISTPSGIPDFRSQGSGLWSRHLPMEVASLTCFRHQPERFFEWLRPLASHMWSAQPNVAHQALAQLERLGLLHTIITQNIDMLHQRAGSRRVLQVHGSLGTLTCTGCYQQVAAQAYIPDYLEHGKMPYCPRCGKLLKPDVVLFEEQLPARTWLEARQASARCDLMLVAGTSLVVAPVAELPMRALQNGARVVIVNQSPTYIDPHAQVSIQGDVAEIIPAILDEVLHG